MSDLTNKRKEKLSAFLDNDMHRDELMSFSLSAEDGDAETAQRYQMMGDALRGEMSESSFIDVSSAVREAIADETLAVENITPSAAPAGNNSGSFFNLANWFRPVAGMAVAATVAVVMVVTLSEQQGADGLGPVAADLVTKPQVQLAIDNQADDAQKSNPHVKQYLMDQHLEFATQDTLQGRLPYVRAVSFESEDKLKASERPIATDR